MATSQKGSPPRKILRIPDLEHSKHAVINSLPAKAPQESYEYAINEFITWYCSEPRLAFNRAPLQGILIASIPSMGIQFSDA